MLRPETEADLAGTIREAAGALAIRGGGTRGIGRPVAGTALSVAGIAGIVLHEPGALTLMARAGTPLSEVEAALAAHGQRLAFEPMDARALLGTAGEPTIGGVVAANASGPRRVQAGAARDFLLGVRFVDGRGTVIANGGRVMKNVTGLDLARLVAGARGTLGVLTEVALKVLPAPETAATLVFEGLDPARAVAAMAAALGSPFEVTGAAHDVAAGLTRLRIEGFADSVAYRADRLAGLLRDFGPVAVEAAAVGPTWAAIRDVAAFADRPGDVWRVHAKATDAPALLARARARAALLDWGGGLIWLLTDEGADLRARLGAFAGHATLWRAAPEARAAIAPFPPEPPAVAALSRALRARFDPRGILNPGLMD